MMKSNDKAIPLIQVAKSEMAWILTVTTGSGAGTTGDESTDGPDESSTGPDMGRIMIVLPGGGGPALSGTLGDSPTMTN
jgi:hypothetical protein